MRIIVDNRSSLRDCEAVDRVGQFMREPSQDDNRTYLAAARFHDSVTVFHRENKNSHTFVVQD